MEQHTGLTVTHDFVVFVRVEFDPVLVLVGLGPQELHRADGSFFLLVGPVPQRHRLISVSSQGHDVLVVSGQVHVGHTIRVGVEVSADGRSSGRIPNNEHGVFA